jgi:hypothetical protein
MKDQVRRILVVILVLGVVVALFRLFPFAMAFVEGAALSIRRFWWVALLLALAIMLWWALGPRSGSKD